MGIPLFNWGEQAEAQTIEPFVGVPFEAVDYDRKAIIESLEKSFQTSLQILNELKNG